MPSYSRILEAGQTTQCVTSPSLTPDFTVTANVTKTLQTCQPWGFTVKGGVPPYVITLAALNSPVVTNVTMPHGDDAFTYIDRADPNGQLIGASSHDGELRMF
jgi:shikimate 5-dehydrogenase